MLCKVKILGSPSGRAEIYIDGKRLDGVIGFKLEQNAYKKRVPELTLRVMCEAEIDSGVVCPLPEPWSMFYEPKTGEELRYP